MGRIKYTKTVHITTVRKEDTLYIFGINFDSLGKSFHTYDIRDITVIITTYTNNGSFFSYCVKNKKITHPISDINILFERLKEKTNFICIVSNKRYRTSKKMKESDNELCF